MLLTPAVVAGFPVLPILTIDPTMQPTARSGCKGGGRRDLSRADGSGFRNQGACVKHVTRRQG